MNRTMRIKSAAACSGHDARGRSGGCVTKVIATDLPLD